MKQVQVTAVGENSFVDVDQPQVGRQDVLIKIKANGICGSDTFYTSIGGIPPRQGHTPLGHEAAGIVADIGSNVDDVSIGDHVVINPMAAEDGIIGNGGAQGALSDYVNLINAKANRNFRIIPKNIPWEVAALNEPMAVAQHAVNRSKAKADSKVAVFGAGPIGLGAIISLKALGVKNVVAIDIIPERLQKALDVGANSIIDSGKEDVLEQLIKFHGQGLEKVPSGNKRSATDIYIDAAGASIVPKTVFKIAQYRAVYTIVAVHKKEVPVNFGDLLDRELDIRLSVGYPTEIFQVTDNIIKYPELYAKIISNVFPFSDALKALKTAATPGAADKVVVSFD
ncbi:theronine dehydrogenase [Oenococcus oeni]|nr:zinc-binding dehydrogenase [Oenococcus oeni]KDP19961.1 theronine dehydrogenase [Oenococcus oeni]KGH62428.1 theronine dehydrogenase [Oenococcus oeni S13]KGH72901.1 theronine dehydrogenase [Oenococcus oeni IOEB_0502]KGH89707.1 theronine dehydrogenase [Oenococcus oeni S12]KMQ39629.1 theronine dehydrogenase [Oenococcus oeni]